MAASDAPAELLLEVPFPEAEQAKIAYDALRVDVEPVRGGVTKKLSVQDNILKAHFESKNLRNLRTSVTSFFDLLSLVTETMDQFSL